MNIPQVITKIQGSFDQPIGRNVSNPFFAAQGISPPVPEGATPGVFNPVDAETVRVGSIWLFSETVKSLNREQRAIPLLLPGVQSPLEKARTAVRIGMSRQTELSTGILTQHALMVPLGEFAHEIGLIQKLQQVHVPQKSVVHAPQAKILTFLMGILTGITHLKDLNDYNELRIKRMVLRKKSTFHL